MPRLTPASAQEAASVHVGNLVVDTWWAPVSKVLTAPRTRAWAALLVMPNAASVFTRIVLLVPESAALKSQSRYGMYPARSVRRVVHPAWLLPRAVRIGKNE